MNPNPPCLLMASCSPTAAAMSDKRRSFSARSLNQRDVGKFRRRGEVTQSGARRGTRFTTGIFLDS